MTNQDKIHIAEVQRYLNDTTTIWVTRKSCNVTRKRRNDKFNFLCRDRFNTFLYHMVSILVMHTSQNMPIKLLYKLHLLIKLNDLKCLQP